MELLLVLAVILVLIAVAGGIWINPVLWLVLIVAVLVIALSRTGRW